MMRSSPDLSDDFGRNVRTPDNDFLPEGFPDGVRVLVVDEDPISLETIGTMLLQCNYKVTTTGHLENVREMVSENEIDIILCDVKRSDVDGMKHLELIMAEREIPVVLMSSESDTEFVMAGIENGAVQHLMKPLRMEELKIIWQHVYRILKMKSIAKINATNPNIPSTTDLVNPDKDNIHEDKVALEEGNENEMAIVIKDQGRHDEEEGDDDEDENDEPKEKKSNKKARVVWLPELHKKFLKAVHQLGIDKAVPKKILELMGVEGLSREKVASHLQKYRLYLKKQNNDLANQHRMLYNAYQTNDTSYLQMYQLENGLSGEIPPTTNVPNSSNFSIPQLTPSPYQTQFMNSFNHLSKYQKPTPAYRELKELLELRDRQTKDEVDDGDLNRHSRNDQLYSLMANQTNLSGSSSNPMLYNQANSSMLHRNTPKTTFMSEFGQSSNHQSSRFGSQYLGGPSSSRALPQYNGQHTQHVPLGTSLVSNPLLGGESYSNQLMPQANPTNMENVFVGEQYQTQYMSRLSDIDSSMIYPSISQQQPYSVPHHYDLGQGQTENIAGVDSNPMDENQNEKSDKPE